MKRVGMGTQEARGREPRKGRRLAGSGAAGRDQSGDGRGPEDARKGQAAARRQTLAPPQPDRH